MGNRRTEWPPDPVLYGGRPYGGFVNRAARWQLHRLIYKPPSPMFCIHLCPVSVVCQWSRDHHGEGMWSEGCWLAERKHAMWPGQSHGGTTGTWEKTSQGHEHATGGGHGNLCNCHLTDGWFQQFTDAPWHCMSMVLPWTYLKSPIQQMAYCIGWYMFVTTDTINGIP